MRKFRLVLAVCTASLVLAQSGTAQQPPQPGPELALLKRLVGDWDTSVKFGDKEGKGIMTYKMELGGLCLVSEFKGEFAGAKFEGKGMDSYDGMKKKYVSVWADSMASGLSMSEGTADQDGKVRTMLGDGPPGPDGKPTKMKSVTEMKDDDNFVLTMSTTDKDGKDQVMGVITSKRKK
jgi:hypothetical protein